MTEELFLKLDKYIKDNYKPFIRQKNNNPLLREPLRHMESFNINSLSSQNRNNIIYESLVNKDSKEDTINNLSKMGYSLSKMDLSDVIILFMLDNNIYDFNFLNEALKKYNLKEYVRVGYQGLFLSNSYRAAKNYFTGNNIIFIPLLNSANVVNKLLNKEIEYGVLAKMNSITGIVKETEEALSNVKYNVISALDLEIHHSIFKRKDVLLKDLKYVGSHIQALLQTKNNRLKLIPKLKPIELEDTAKSAIDLKDGILPKDYAIICPKQCGLANELDLIYENVEDDKNNKTSFIVISL